MIMKDQGLEVSVPRSPLNAAVGNAFDPPLTLLIASENLLSAWSAHARRATRIITVVDRDLPGTVDVIRLKQPSQIILEQTFATSGRGAPLMTVLYAERRFRGTQIRLLTPEGLRALLRSHPGHTPAQTWLTSFAVPLPSRPSQRAPRVRVPAGHRTLIDGRPELLVDVSPLGAQIRATVVLRPGQHVKVTPHPDDDTFTVSGVVVWSAFEPSPDPCYRAGIAFSTAIQLEHLVNRSAAAPRRIRNSGVPSPRTEVCAMCHSKGPASRMAALLGRRLCFDCAAACYDDDESE